MFMYVLRIPARSMDMRVYQIALSNMMDLRLAVRDTMRFYQYFRPWWPMIPSWRKMRCLWARNGDDGPFLPYSSLGPLWLHG